MDDTVLKPYSFSRMELAKLAAKRVAVKHRAYSVVILACWAAVLLEPKTPLIAHAAFATILLFVGVLPMVPYFTYFGWKGKLLELHAEPRYVRFNEERLVLETANGVQSIVPFKALNYAAFGPQYVTLTFAGSAVPIPMSSFNSPEDLQRLKAIVDRNNSQP